MRVRSLGYRTDLEVLRLGGSEITVHPRHLVVRTPANPGYYWGNFLLLDPAAALGDPGAWVGRFSEQLPGARHLALGVDRGPGDLPAARAIAAAGGLGLQRITVLTARALRPPAHPAVAAVVRELCSADDWRQLGRLHSALEAEEGQFSLSHRLFLRRRRLEWRRLSGTGRGARFGAFLEGELRASLGLVEVEAGWARYQNVETQAGWRRRGLASCLLAHAASWARSTWGTQTLVLAADPKGPAIHLYRALGFRARETQLQIQRPPPPEGPDSVPDAHRPA